MRLDLVVFSTVWMAVCLISVGCSCSRGGPTLSQKVELSSMAHPGLSAASAIQFPSGLCNSVTFSQIPSRPEYFIGRRLKNVSSDPCSGDRWILSLFKIDFTSNQLSWVRDLVVPEAQIFQERVGSAYDPTVTVFNGQVWIAFECSAIVGPIHKYGVASSCVGPLAGDLSGIDLNRTTLVIKGVSSDKNSDYYYSGSVPKIFSFKDRLYLYWSAVQAKKDAPLTMLSITTRGMELSIDAKGRVWGLGSPGRSVESNNPKLNVEVMGLNPNDPYMSNIVDMYQAFADGDSIYVTAGIGGKGCINQHSHSYGCYRAAIFKSDRPLGYRVFQEQKLVAPQLPMNPQEFLQFYHRPKGKLALKAMFFKPKVTHDTPDEYWIDFGMFTFDVDLQQWKFESIQH